MDSLAGSRLGRFRIDRLIGKGGMSHVYAAVDESLDREVAIKVLGSKLDAEPRRRELLREARLAARLSHPNIASIHEIGDSDGHLYIVMELLEGETLRSLLEKRRLSREEVLAIGRDVARALARAHAGDVIHRDIKPENIFITRPSPDVILAKVLDFGLARDEVRAPAEPASEATGEAGACGTAGYLAPEQARGLVVDSRADVFSFGAVIYEMLTGKRAFDGRNHLARMLAVVKEPSPRLPPAPHLEPQLSLLVDRCLAKAREERFADGGALLAAIERLGWGDVGVRASKPFLDAPTPNVGALAAGLPTAEGESSTRGAPKLDDVSRDGEEQLASTTASPTTTSNPPPGRSPIERRRLVVPLVGAGVAALLGAGLIVLSGARSPVEAPAPASALVAAPAQPATEPVDSAAANQTAEVHPAAPAMTGSRAGQGVVGVRRTSTPPRGPSSARVSVEHAPLASADPPRFGTIRIRQSDVLTVIVDGEHRRVRERVVLVSCGRHKVRVGFRDDRLVDVPCGGTVTL